MKILLQAWLKLVVYILSLTSRFKVGFTLQLVQLTIQSLLLLIFFSSCCAGKSYRLPFSLSETVYGSPFIGF